MKIFHLLFILGVSLCILSCNQGPKIIATPVSSESSSSSGSTGIFSDESNTALSQTVPASSDVHTVNVLEVLPTSKYVYLKVDEKGEEFWIATSKKDVLVGETYFYKNGILKTNFESKEHNRVFDKVYLVANIVPANHGNQTSIENPEIEKQTEVESPSQIEVEGSIKISELVNNKSKYDGKEIQISGRCNKLNPNIMGRNWIHLKDGSKDDFDLVITSEHAVPEGHIVTMKGTVVLDKDFGAGYKYDLIIENGEIVARKD